ncbi:DsbA family protein [bacterium]|nr:DsbA family protein [bacterium]
MNKKEKIFWAVFVVVVIAAVAGIIWGAKDGSVKMAVDDDVLVGHERGAPDAKVILTEFGDFQCPACGAYHPLTTRLIEERGDKVKYVFKNFPLANVHQNATAAAEAAEAAALQNKFWDMHDMLFEHQDEWSAESNPTELFAKYAIEIGLDPRKFREDMKSPGVSETITADIAAGSRAGVSYTPYLLLNGERIETPQGYDELLKVIDAALAEALPMETGTEDDLGGEASALPEEGGAEEKSAPETEDNGLY